MTKERNGMKKLLALALISLCGLVCVTTLADETAVQHAALPFLSITTDSGELPGDEMAYGSMTLTQDGREQTVRIGVRLRGNTSRRFPKKSYRLIILDEDGEKMNLSIGGLRSDDDWILNPMYTDTSKIREALAYEVWDAMNSSGVKAQSSRLVHAEISLNGEYWGLYGVQERIDRKQVDADKRSGVLYKVSRLEIPAVQDVLSCEGDTCAGFELDFAGAGVKNPWEPAAGYMGLYHGEAANLPVQMDEANLIDYGLWMMFTQAHDCHFKNQFLHGVYADHGYTMYKIPWDVNHTFGDVWENDAEDSNFNEYRIVDFMMDGIFETRFQQGDEAFDQAVRNRWHQLREGILTEENLIRRAHALYDPLADALERDNARWPESGLGNGNALNINDIEEYIRLTLGDLDALLLHPSH